MCSDLVSVIIPTYNRACLLLEALGSTASQTYRPIEVIVIDDGSTDNTEELVKDFANIESSENFHVVYLQQENKGPAAARNTGLKAASGEYIQFLDSDDLIHPRKFEIQVKLLKSQPEIQCAFSERFDFRGLPDWVEIQTEALKFKVLKGYNLYCAFNALVNSGLYKRQICSLAGFWNEDMHLCEDLEFNLRVLSLCDEVFHTEIDLAGRRQHEGHQMTTDLSQNESRHENLIGFQFLQDTALHKIKNPKKELFEAIGILYNRLALDFMLSGDREGALKTINSCKQMPLTQRRLKRLSYLNLLAYMPVSWLRLLWKMIILQK